MRKMGKKVVVNKCYGSARLEDWVVKYLKVDPWDFDREDPRIVRLVEEYGDTCSSSGSALVVVTLPDDATDYMISEYDGAETLIYVQNGKLHTDFELGAD